MNTSKIPDKDWNVIKKYSINDIRKQFLLKDAIPKPTSDLFIMFLILLNIFFITIFYLFMDKKNLIIICFSVPMLIGASSIILGYHYGKNLKYIIYTLIYNCGIFIIAEYLMASFSN